MRFETSLSDVKPRTYNVKSYRFPRPESFNYRAGQFMFVTIKKGEERLRKHFTISSSPTDKDSIEFTKKLTGSVFSNALNSLRIGDWAEIEGPYGEFTFEGELGMIALISGGIGITPSMSICRYCTEKKLETDIVLMYGNRTESDIAFREELAEMERRNKNLKVSLALDEPGSNWTGLVGRIDANLIKMEVPSWNERTYYVCGPPGMVGSMSGVLSGLGIPRKQIKMENFTGY